MEELTTTDLAYFPVKGMIKTSFLDWPGKICTVLFTGGCNFRCAFCHNPELVVNPEKMQSMDETEIFAYLSARKGWVEGVCITGGEPTLFAQGLERTIKKIKELGFLVKLDTNGTNPELLAKLVDSCLIDYVAMDIKGPITKYAEITGNSTDLKKVEESVKILKSGSVPYEFRTTVLPRFHNVEEIGAMAEWLSGSEKLVLQQFRPGKTLRPEVTGTNAYSEAELRTFVDILAGKIKNVEIRGV